MDKQQFTGAKTKLTPSFESARQNDCLTVARTSTSHTRKLRDRLELLQFDRKTFSRHRQTWMFPWILTEYASSYMMDNCESWKIAKAAKITTRKQISINLAALIKRRFAVQLGRVLRSLPPTVCGSPVASQAPVKRERSRDKHYY